MELVRQSFSIGEHLIVKDRRWPLSSPFPSSTATTTCCCGCIGAPARRRLRPFCKARTRATWICPRRARADLPAACLRSSCRRRNARIAPAAKRRRKAAASSAAIPRRPRSMRRRRSGPSSPWFRCCTGSSASRRAASASAAMPAISRPASPTTRWRRCCISKAPRRSMRISSFWTCSTRRGCARSARSGAGRTYSPTACRSVARLRPTSGQA